MAFNQLQTRQFQDRRDAGQQLARRLLSRYRRRPHTLVLALPRGGVPVAFEVAATLELPLDICLVRKLGAPGHAELAIGAIAASGVRVLNADLIEQLAIPPHWIEQVTAAETAELERRQRVYRLGRPPMDLTDQTVILVDDGVATGATLRAALAILRQSQVKAIVVAVPVAHPAVVAELRPQVDDIVCLITPEPLQSISLWYSHFDQTDDDTVRALLQHHDHHFSPEAIP